MKYVVLYDFQVMAAIAEKREVYVLDKMNVRVCNIMEICVEELAEILVAAKKDADRFMFWEQVMEVEDEQE